MLFVFARLALYVPSCRTCLIVNVLAFYTNADLIARLLRERLCCVLFIIYIVPFSIIYYYYIYIIYIYIYIRYEHEIITQQVYMFAFCSIDGSASIANRHRTVHDEGPQRTVSPCPLSASIITCLKCANDPTPNALCLSLSDISEEIETHRRRSHPDPTDPTLYLVRLSRDSRFYLTMLLSGAEYLLKTTNVC